MIWLPWRRKLAQADDRLHEAERLRDEAEVQRCRATQLKPEVDRVSSSLQRLHSDNHFGPLIDSLLRGNE